MIVESLGTYLSAYSGLVALVGARIYPGGRAPDGVAYPYVTWRVRIEPENTLGEIVANKLNITVTGVARSPGSHSGYYQVHQIAEQARAALDHFRGTLKAGGDSSTGSLVMSTEDGEAAEFGVFETITEAEMWV